MAEMLKSYHNRATDYMVWHYRDKDNQEADIMIETDGQLHPLEIKWVVNSAAGPVGAFEYWIRRLYQVARARFSVHSWSCQRKIVRILLYRYEWGEEEVPKV